MWLHSFDHVDQNYLFICQPLASCEFWRFFFLKLLDNFIPSLEISHVDRNFLFICPHLASFHFWRLRLIKFVG